MGSDFWLEGFVDYASRPFRQAALLDWVFWIVVLGFGAFSFWALWCERRADQGRAAPAFSIRLSWPWRWWRRAVQKQGSGTT